MVDADPTAVDREWYDTDEAGGVVFDDESQAFLTPSLPSTSASTSTSNPNSKAPPTRPIKKVSARAQQVQEDNARWEENRMLQSGVVTATSVDMDFVSETEAKVQLTVLDMRPPFLDGRTAFTTQQEMVSVVRDPTNDVAVIAKKGSALLQSLREKKERSEMKTKFWEVAGSHLGRVIGVKEEGEGAGGEGSGGVKAEGGGKGEEEGDVVDYRQSSQFAAHLKEANTAQSEFSATRSIAAQREYLPIYTCKDELMRVIRDNPIVVIVGETGSGKCFARGTRLRLVNGDTVAVEHVVGGEQLMGDDGLPRTVTPGSLTQGVAPLYRITPTWEGARPFTVNGAHILVLANNLKPYLKEWSDGGWRVVDWQLTTDNRMVQRSRTFRTKARAQTEIDAIFAAGWAPLKWEPTVEEFLHAPASVRAVCNLVACKAITFTNPLLRSLHEVITLVLGQSPSTAQLEYMAWWLGMWMTDAASDRPSISWGGAPSPDPQHHHDICARLRDYKQLFHEPVARVDARVSSAGWPACWSDCGVDSVAGRVLQCYGLLCNKRIPQALICDSLGVRQRLLAGIIDGGGHYHTSDNAYEISAQHLSLITGCKKLAATLGLRNSAVAVDTATDQRTGQTHGGHRFSISGDLWDVVQYCAAIYKRCPQPGAADYVEKSADSRCYGFSITELPAGEYFGFAVHGGVNRRFLLDDFTVTHNVSPAHHPSTLHPLLICPD